MKELLTCEQMKQTDAWTMEKAGVPSAVLMERASLACLEALTERFADRSTRFLVVCGSGNNGGDGIALARLLTLAGYQAEIFMAGNPEKMTDMTRLQYGIASYYKVPFVEKPDFERTDVVVDAVFGVGLSREIGGVYAELIDRMNHAAAFKFAVDIPSGVHGDNGQILGIAFQADLTVTMAYAKPGQLLYPGKSCCGELIVADIGIYHPGSGQLGIGALRPEEKDLDRIPDRDPAGNKGTFGKVLIVGGSVGMCGAAYFAAAAALRAGAGMVMLQTAEENRIPLQMLLPEAMVRCGQEEIDYTQCLNWCDILVIGPGLGTEALSRKRLMFFLREGQKAGKPMILDADGINLLAVCDDLRGWLNGVILTPHMGEMSRLTGKTIRELKSDPIAAARSAALETKAILVLKDASTVISDGEKAYIVSEGNPGMATAGSGDVLAGILGGMCCIRRIDPGISKSEAAALGVLIHARAGKLAAEKAGSTRGITASDLIEEIRSAMRV